ncbi:MAG: hypothetical protein Q7S40_05310, partial [Opitutaceae bacterium]|nr:hypothetical protein [Opitutaceae bacterium]
MARKLRLEYAGAVYHIINRGNYRAAIFRDEGAKLAFLACLDEACGPIRRGQTLMSVIGWTTRFHQQHESRLREVMIAREHFFQSFATHCLE